MTVLSAGKVVTPDGVVAGASVSVEAGKIAGITRGPAPPGAVDLAGKWLLPGFIDLHVHGGGGHDVTVSPEDMAAAVAFHRRHGTTRTLVSLAAAAPSSMIETLGWVTDLVDAGPGQFGHVIGSHLEGPFLAESRRGAQIRAHLLMPDRNTFAKLLEAARGALRSVTIAPELPGALELVSDVVEAGAVAAIGHTDATYDEARAAIDGGATLATHLFNGMRPVHHREPGVVWAALVAGIACEVINDGVHVHPAVTTLLGNMPGRLVLVTDAIQAAGMSDGDCTVGGLHVQVLHGQARLAGTDTLCGSTLTMDAALRRAVTECSLPIEVASAAASANPARVLGIDDECGAIAVGLAADLVVLDEDLTLAGVMAGGVWGSPYPGSA